MKHIDLISNMRNTILYSPDFTYYKYREPLWKAHNYLVEHIGHPLMYKVRRHYAKM